MSNLAYLTNAFLYRLELWARFHQADHPALSKIAAALHHALTAVPVEILYLVVMFAAAAVLLAIFVATIAGFSTYLERRVAARMQARMGCNRVGPEGILQFLADGIKLILKEDTIPRGADRPLFKLAPYLVVLGAFLSFVTIPFGKRILVADLNIGLLYLISVSGFVVVGILLSGWASNNKWSLLGSMRSAAQIVSYEIPIALSLMVPILLAGSLSLQALNTAQAGGVRNWFVAAAFPAPLIAFFVYFIAALAEVNRAPFDLPEAESELVAGFATEYSGIRWGLFFIAEYANMFLVSAIAVTAFLGGWQPSRSNIFFAFLLIFFVLFMTVKSLGFLLGVVRGLVRGKSIYDLLSTVRPARFSRWGWIAIALLSLPGALALNLVRDFAIVEFIHFAAKVYFFVFVMMWLRWTLPRIRIDQLMGMAWKKLVPISLFCVLWTALFMVVLA